MKDRYIFVAALVSCAIPGNPQEKEQTTQITTVQLAKAERLEVNHPPPSNHRSWERLARHIELHSQGLDVPPGEQVLLSCVEECYSEVRFRECTQWCLDNVPAHPDLEQQYAIILGAPGCSN
jgi:hypothetical protein